MHSQVIIYLQLQLPQIWQCPALLLPNDVQGIVGPVHKLRGVVRQVCVCHLQGCNYRYQMTQNTLPLYELSNCKCLWRPSP